MSSAFRGFAVVAFVAVCSVGQVSIAIAEDRPASRTVVIPATIPFAEGAYIPENVKAECDLPARQSEWLAQGLRSRGYTVIFQQPGDPDQDTATLKVQISSAFASGNAFIGHSKGMSLSGTLIQNGQKLGSFVAFRKSGGGAFGGFKGSCAVMIRCAKTLGEDVAKWLEAPTNDARLGSAQ